MTQPVAIAETNGTVINSSVSLPKESKRKRAGEETEAQYVISILLDLPASHLCVPKLEDLHRVLNPQNDSGLRQGNELRFYH